MQKISEKQPGLSFCYTFMKTFKMSLNTFTKWKENGKYNKQKTDKGLYVSF
jgi:hypothetical protein